MNAAPSLPSADPCPVRTVGQRQIHLLLPSLALAGLLLCGNGQAAPEPQISPVLMEGSWTYTSPSDILGSHTAVTVTFSKRTNEWTIHRVTTRLKVQGFGTRHSTTNEDGPHRIALENNKLVIYSSQKLTAHTFLCNSNLLVMPAIVQTKPGEWEYQSESESFQVRCEQDPSKVPVGKAGISGVIGGRGYYSFEEGPRPGSVWPREQRLRFLERSEEKGQLIERFRLIFDDYGYPRYQPISLAGHPTSSPYEVRVYTATASQ